MAFSLTIYGSGLMENWKNKSILSNFLLNTVGIVHENFFDSMDMSGTMGSFNSCRRLTMSWNSEFSSVVSLKISHWVLLKDRFKQRFLDQNETYLDWRKTYTFFLLHELLGARIGSLAFSNILQIHKNKFTQLSYI